MKTLSTIALLVVMASCGKPSLFGTPYSRLNCSQLACVVSGHRMSTAKQLFEEGTAITAPLKPGDIVAFRGAHVAVVAQDGGLLDSTPERGVGRISRVNPNDLWYAGPVRVVRK